MKTKILKNLIIAISLSIGLSVRGKKIRLKMFAERIWKQFVYWTVMKLHIANENERQKMQSAEAKMRALLDDYGAIGSVGGRNAVGKPKQNP